MLKIACIATGYVVSVDCHEAGFDGCRDAESGRIPAAVAATAGCCSGYSCQSTPLRKAVGSKRLVVMEFLCRIFE